MAKRQDRTESEVLRPIIDAYLQEIEKKGLTYEPFRKLSPVGLKTLPRTIRKEQDRKLREIAEKTGRKISELVREAVEEFEKLLDKCYILVYTYINYRIQRGVLEGGTSTLKK